MLVDCTLVASILGLAGTFLPVLSLLSPFKIVNGILDFVRDFFLNTYILVLVLVLVKLVFWCLGFGLECLGHPPSL